MARGPTPSTPLSSSRSHFRQLAPSYPRLRPLIAGDRNRVRQMLERCPVPAGGAIAELGCGSGKLLVEAARVSGARTVVGVDSEPAMLVAGHGFEAREGRAEAAPLEDSAYDLVFTSLAFHLFGDRPRAAAEMRRAARPGGHGAIWTLTPEHVDRHPLNRYYPSLAEVDRGRFEPPERWAALLAAAGFDWVAEAELPATRVTTIGRLALRARRRWISTLALLPPGEFERGTAELEREAAADPRRRIAYAQIWCLIWAGREAGRAGS